MTNIERLLTKGDSTELKRARVLVDFIASRNAIALVNALRMTQLNRGDMFECAITLKNVVRTGLHEMSKGDYKLGDLIVEIKYLTTKTKADIDARGTHASHYLIGFNNGKRIELRLIKKSDLVVENGKVTYQNNFNRGEVISL